MTHKPAMVNDIAQAHVRLDMLDTHMDNMAAPRTLWEKSYLCPCRNRATRQPDPSCHICRGRGIAYLPPKRITIIIQSQEKGIYNGDLGLIDAGTAIGTPDRGVRISFRDRITMPSTKISQSFIFDATHRRVEHGFYMVYDVHEVEFATTMQGELVEGQDYTIDLEKNLFYPKEHLLGQNISLNILTSLRYMVADLLKEHRYSKQPDGSYEKSPQKLLLKREDLFVNKDAFDQGEDCEDNQMIDTKRQATDDGLNGFFRGGA